MPVLTDQQQKDYQAKYAGTANTVSPLQYLESLSGNSAPIVNGLPVMNTDVLQGKGTQPVIPPPVTPTTSNAAFVAGLNTATPGLPPSGWDAQTYANFKAANPGLEPDAEDTALMLAGTEKTTPTIQNAELSKRLAAAQEKLLGKGAEQQKLEVAAGIPQNLKDIAALREDIARSTGAFNLAASDISGRPIGIERQTGKIAQVERNAAIQLGNKAAVLQALQGNLKDARDQVDRTLAQEFDPIQQEIDNLIQFKEFNQDDLTEKEKIELNAQIDKQKMEYQAKLDLANYKAKSAIDKAAENAGYNFAPTAPSTYTVKASDLGHIPFSNLQQVATAAGITLQELQAANPQITNDKIKVGDVINLPTTNLQNNKNALNVILGSGKFTKDQKADLIKAINSGQDPFTVIKNQAKNIAGATEGKVITNFEVAKGQLRDIGNLLNTYYANGGKTSYLSGRYEKVLNNLGTVKDPKLVNIATQIAAALQIYRNAVSGTAYSVQEGADIASIFPGINKNEGLNTAIVNGRIAAFDSTIDNSYRSVLGSVYDQLKGANSQSSFLDSIPTVSTNSSTGADFWNIFKKQP